MERFLLSIKMQGEESYSEAKIFIFKDFDKDNSWNSNADGEIYALKTHSQASDLVMPH